MKKITLTLITLLVLSAQLHASTLMNCSNSKGLSLKVDLDENKIATITESQNGTVIGIKEGTLTGIQVLLNLEIAIKDSNNNTILNVGSEGLNAFISGEYNTLNGASTEITCKLITK